MNDNPHKTILLTAFEPSGDALGATAATGLREIEPSIRLVGLGGKEMQAAGVELLEHTTDDAAMGIGAVSKVLRVKRLVDKIDSWIEEHQPDVVVTVDSPAANFPVCKVARKHGRKIVHFAAPQLWAWAPWRIRKLRRLTDHVMCLLPFEPEWFASRGVKATFVGHPAMGEHDIVDIQLPEGQPNIVLLPGSRSREISSNLPMQIEALQRICLEHQGTEAVIACREEDIGRVEQLAGDLRIVSGNMPSVLAWADLALNVSGTVSLHIMRHGTPMIGMYKVNPFSMLGSKLMLNTPNRLLPNLIAGKRIVPEFIPCGNIPHQIADVALDLLDDDEAMKKQRASLQEITSLYEHHDPARESAAIILSYVMV